MPVAASTSSAPVDLLVNVGKNQSTKTLLRVIILCFIAAAAVASRLFSVIRMFIPPHPLLLYFDCIGINY